MSGKWMLEKVDARAPGWTNAVPPDGWSCVGADQVSARIVRVPQKVSRNAAELRRIIRRGRAGADRQRDADGWLSLRTCRAWEDYDVKGDIERRLGTTVILENDANAAALGETMAGRGPGVESLCMYTLGTGVGGGLILDGKIWRGWNGMAGELGHCNVEPEGHPCKCGSWGCLEQYASATAVVRMAERLWRRGPVSELPRSQEASSAGGL